MNRRVLEQKQPSPPVVHVVCIDAAEMDEMWSFVQSKRQQRWLWHAIDPDTGEVLAYVFAPHEDAALSTLMQLLTPFGIQQFYTDNWGAYRRLLDPAEHTVGKSPNQRIERQRTRQLRLFDGCLPRRIR